MLNAEERKKQMQGFKETAKILKLERIQRLRNMTREESMKIYDDLCEFYYSQHAPYDAELDRERQKFLVRRRKILDALGDKRDK